MKKTDKVFQVHKKKKLQMNRTVKKIIFASSASILIGLAFGYFFLQMIKQDETATSVIENVPKSIENNDELRILPKIEVYVIQGGVFAELENYENWETKYNNVGLPAIKWQRDDTYHLLAGVAQTEETAQGATSKLTENGLDVFVKQWTVPSAKFDLSEMDHQWLLSFLDVWNETLLTLEKNTTFPHETWKDLVQEGEDKSTEVNALNKVIQDKMKSQSEISREEIEQLLLFTLREYEQIFATN